MTTISGNDHTFTNNEFLRNKGQVIERDSITQNSTDVTPSASDILSNLNGTIGFEFFLGIYNSSSEYTITLTPGTGFTMKPGLPDGTQSDVIQPKVIKQYKVVTTGASSCTIYNIDLNGQRMVTEKLITNVIERETVVEPVIIYQDGDADITLGGDPPANVSVNGDLLATGNVYKFRSVATINASNGVTYSTGQILGGFIKRELSGNETDSLPTAADIVAAIPNARIGTSFACYVQNASSSNRTLYINGNTGTTLSGNDNSFSRRYTCCLLFVVANINPGSEAVTAYILGTLRDANGGAADLTVTVTSDSYTVLESDNTINVNYSGSGWWWSNDTVDITLPAISSVGQKRYFITDTGGYADNVPIRIFTSGGDTILGESSATINSRYSSLSMYNDETSNWILY